MTQSSPISLTIPRPRPSDVEDVSWALSTAAALWMRGAADDAVRWVRRAAEAANDQRDDRRATELFRLAAELSPEPAAPSSNPPSGVRAAPRPSEAPPSVRSTRPPSAPPPGPPRPAGQPKPPPAPLGLGPASVRPAPMSSRPPASRPASLPPPSGIAAGPTPLPTAPKPPRLPAVEVVEAEPEPIEAAPLAAPTPTPIPVPAAIEAPPTPSATGFQARVMVIPTSRRGELKILVVPPGTDPPEGMLTAMLEPSGADAQAIRSLLFGIE